MRINHNVAALQAHNAANPVNRALERAAASLATGLRINSAADDAAGAAVAEKMHAQIRGLDQAARNSQDGVSMIQIADGALGEVQSILQRMRELSVQAGSDSLTQGDRAYVQWELDALREEIDRIGNTTQFNKKKLLDGSASALWSSSDQGTRAIVNGALERAANYRITIEAEPGQSEARKTHVFTLTEAGARAKAEKAKEETEAEAGGAASAAGRGAFARTVGSVDKSYTATRTEMQETTVAKTLNLNVSGLTNLGPGKKMNTGLKTATSAARTDGSNNAHYNNNDPDPNFDMPDYDDLVIGDMEISLKQLSSAAYTPITFTGASGWYTREDGSGGRFTGTRRYSWDPPGIPATAVYTSTMFPRPITMLTDDPSETVQIGFVIQANYNPPYNSYKDENTFTWKSSQSLSLIHDANIIDPDKFYFKVGRTEYNVSPDKLAGKKVKFEDVSVASGGPVVEIDFTGFTAGEIKSAVANGGVFTRYEKENRPQTVTDTVTTTYAADYGPAAGTTAVTDTYAKDGRTFDKAVLLSMFDASGLEGVNLALSAEVVSDGVARLPLTLSITGRGLDIHGDEVKIAPLAVTLGGGAQTISFDVNGVTRTLGIDLNGLDPAAFKKGDKFALFLSDPGEADEGVTVKSSGGPSVAYHFKKESVRGKTLELTQYGYDQGDGSDPSDGGVLAVGLTVEVPSAEEALAAQEAQEAARAEQEAAAREAMRDRAARGDSELRHLRSFIDSAGRSLLDAPKTITVAQGDGRRASFTLNADDTLASVAEKLNAAIGYGLGQARYADGDDDFARFVEEPGALGAASVRGTIVINSAVAGAAGRLRLSGDGEIIAALGLNTIREARESEFRVRVEDAHSGFVKASARVSGNRLYGLVDRNADVTFDAMSDTRAVYDEETGFFDLRAGDGAVTYLHLSDNATVLQVGANEREAMRIDIGDMRAHALSLGSVSAADREAAARSVSVIDGAIDRVSRQRAKLGAYQNRLGHTANNLAAASENLTAARSRVSYVDMARAMMSFTKLRIIQQAATVLQAQANILPQNILALMR